MLLTRLENDNLLTEDGSSPVSSRKSQTAAFSSLASVIAIGYLLQSPKAEILIERQLAELLATVLKYLAGWLHVDPPISIINTKFGFVPNRETCKISPHREAYSVLTSVLGLLAQPQESLNLPNEFVSCTSYISHPSPVPETPIKHLHLHQSYDIDFVAFHMQLYAYE